MALLCWLSSFWRNLFHKSRMDEELNEELRSYVELLTEEKIRQGLSTEKARRASLIEVGGIEQVKERVREVRAGAIMTTFLRDTRYGARSLAKNPGFTLVAALTLALGIGANTAIFSFVNAVLLRSLPVAAPERLVYVFGGSRTNPYNVSSYPDYVDYRDKNKVFSDLIAYSPITLSLSGDDGGDGQADAI